MAVRLALLAMIAVATLSVQPVPTQATTTLLGPIALYTGTDYNFAPAYVAAAKGFFRRHGVDVTAQSFSSGSVAVEAIRSAKVGYVLAGDLPSMKTWSIGDIVGIAPLAWSNAALSIVANKDIKSAADLRGKKVATILGASDEIFFTEYLAKHGLQREDVDMINLNPGDMPVALARGEIVALLGNTPTTSKALRAAPGSHYLQKGIAGIGTNRIIVNAMRVTSEGDPKLSEDVLSALNEAINYMSAHPDETYKVIAAKLGAPLDVVKENVRIFHYSMAVDRSFVEDMTTESRLAVRLGMMKHAINWGTQFNSSFLRAVDKNLVVVQP